MRGNIWSIVALGVGLVMLPLIIDGDATLDSTGETVMTLVSAIGPVVALAFVVATFGLLVTLFSNDSF